MLAYDGGLGAIGVRLVLAVFIMRGGRVDGVVKGADAGPFEVGDSDGDDASFNIGDSGVGDEEILVAMLGSDRLTDPVKGWCRWRWLMKKAGS